MADFLLSAAAFIVLMVAVGLVRVTRWSLWLGTALMVSSGLTSFALGWRTIARALEQFLRRRTNGEADLDPIGHLEVPLSWMFVGGVPVTLGLVLLSTRTAPP